MSDYYALDNSWKHANRRLALLEQMLDPMTQRRINMLGVGHGARCLEVAAGSGSIAEMALRASGADRLRRGNRYQHHITRSDPSSEPGVLYWRPARDQFERQLCAGPEVRKR